MKILSVSAAALVLTLGAMALPAEDGELTLMFGKLTVTQFDAVNKAGVMRVAAIRPSAVPLSEKDAKLLNEMAEACLINQETSRVAVQKANDPMVVALAVAEIEEQMGLTVKIQEIALKKGSVAYVAGDEVADAVRKISDKSGTDFDKAYLKRGAIHGHKSLKKIMEKARKEATDPALVALAVATLPIIDAHLAAAEGARPRLDRGD